MGSRIWLALLVLLRFVVRAPTDLWYFLPVVASQGVLMSMCVCMYVYSSFRMLNVARNLISTEIFKSATNIFAFNTYKYTPIHTEMYKYICIYIDTYFPYTILLVCFPTYRPILSLKRMFVARISPAIFVVVRNLFNAVMKLSN